MNTTDCGNCGQLFEAASEEAAHEFHRYCPTCQTRLDSYQHHCQMTTSAELTIEIKRLEGLNLKDAPKREYMLASQAVTDAYFHRRRLYEKEQGLPLTAI